MTGVIHSDATGNEERVLVFSLFGADAPLTQEFLLAGGIASHVCADIDALAKAIAEGAAAVVVTEEALLPNVADRLVAVLDEQPPWSDLPIIVSVTERDYATGLVGHLSTRINVVPLERPVRIPAMISTVRSALRARRRQYEARDLLRSLERLTIDLSALEEEMRTVVENLPELAWSARPDGYVTFYNRRWYEYTGTTFEEMEGWSSARVQDPKFLPKVAERWRHSLETGEPFEMEFPIRRADGVFRWFLTRVTPLRDKAGRIVRWVGVNVDVDDKRRVAEERDLFTRRTALLARASEELSASLDVERCLQGLANALLESIATSASIDLVGENGTLEGVTVLVDRDAELALRSRQLRKAHPLGPTHPLMQALKHSKARIDSSPAVDPEVSAGVDRRPLPASEPHVSSTIVAPMIARGSTVGV
ncbi:MAG: PAS domain-containing protein, partial [Myxococcota bacterium]|nr:PAS domain-containing protein [Myxococcota bacterium]